MTDTEMALRRAVASHPEEGTCRAALCDWWGENGQEERALYVGLCEEAERIPGDPAVPHPLDNMADLERKRVLLRRADDLMVRHRDEWRKVPCPACRGTGDGMLISSEGMGKRGVSRFAKCPECGGGDIGGLGQGYRDSDGRFANVVHWRGGFPYAVECVLDEVLTYGRKRCKAKGCESGTIGRPRPGDVGGQWMGRMCHECDGTGEVTGSEWRATDWARRVVTWWPVVEFRPTDRETYGENFAWYNADRPHPRGEYEHPASELPAPVFEALEGWCGRWHSREKTYYDRQAALTAMYRAVATIVRRGA